MNTPLILNKNGGFLFFLDATALENHLDANDVVNNDCAVFDADGFHLEIKVSNDVVKIHDENKSVHTGLLQELIMFSLKMKAGINVVGLTVTELSLELVEKLGYCE